MEFLIFIIVGAMAGGLASKIMGANTGFFMNVILGVIGASIGGWLFTYFGWSLGWGWIGDIIIAAIGAMIPIGIYKLISK